MLQFQRIQAPFRFGLAEGTDPHQVPPGTLTIAENVEWQKTGRLQKRSGTTSLTKSGLLSSASRIFARGSEICVIDGTYLYAYSTAEAGWVRVGRVPNLGLTWSTALDLHSGVAEVDSQLAANGMLVTAWVTGDPTVATTTGNVYVRVTDNATGTTLMAPKLLWSSTAEKLRVLVIGTNAYVLFKRTNFAMCIMVSLTSLALGTQAALSSDVKSSSGFDACVVGSNIAICFTNNSSSAFGVALFSTSLTAVTSSFTFDSTAPNVPRFASIDGSASDFLYVAYVTSAGLLSLASLNPSTLARIGGPATVENLATPGCAALGVCRFDSSTCVVVYTTNDSPGRTTSYRVSSSATTDTQSERGTYGVRLGSKPFVFGGHAYAVGIDNPTTVTSTSTFWGSNSILFEVDTASRGSVASYVPHSHIGKIDNLVAGTTTAGQLPAATSASSTQILLNVPFLSDAPAKNTVWRCGARLVSITSGTSMPVDTWRTFAYGQEAYVAGPILTAYDGRAAFDYGFSRAPVWEVVSISGPTGNVANGTYLYGAGLEFRSHAGVLHRSPVSTVTAVQTVATTGTIAGTIKGCNVTTKQSLTSGFGTTTTAPPVFLALYRSTVGSVNYHRLSFEPTYNIVYVNLLNGTQSFTDASADSDIGGTTDLSTRPVMYTSGGVLDDEQPPALTTMLFHKSRLWGVDGSGSQIWFSKSFQDDAGVAPGFSTSFRLQFDEPVTALGTLDDKLVVFSARGIHVVFGGDNGPAADGSGSDISAPQVVQSDVGCINPRSVVSTPSGVMFLATGTRLYMLGRSLAVQYVGKPVQDQIAVYPSITSAVLVPAKNQVRFTCNNAAGTSGIVLVFDYVEGQWSTFKYYDTDTSTASCPIADACLVSGVYTFVTPAGKVYQENATTFLDDGSHWVTSTLETAWMSAAGPVGFQSVRHMNLDGTSNSNHDLTVSVGFDSDASYPQAVTFRAGSGVTSIGTLDTEITIGTRRKCSSIRFKIQDATPTSPGTYPVGTGQGPSFETLGIEVGTKGGPNTPATKKG